MPGYEFAPNPNIATDTLWTPQVWNLEIRRAAQPLYTFRQFARDVRSSYPGNDTTLAVLKTSTVATPGGTLTAGTPVPRTGFSVGTVTYTPKEYGNAISPEARLLNMSPFAMQETIRDLLARDAALQLDTAIRNTLVSGITAGVNSFNMGAGGTVVGTTVPSYSGTVATNAPSYRLTAYGVWAAVDYLASQNAPKIYRQGVGEGYIGILHPFQARGIKRDSQFISAVQYADANRLLNNEIGFWEGVYWIETTQGYYQSAVTGAYCALIFGAQCYGEYVIRELQLKEDPPTDFGRQLHFAWLFDGGWAVEYPEYLAGIWSLSGTP
jgi:N4-gp56 family major capsid protein